METYLGKSQNVPFDALYLDPNNPRLAPEDPPGYDDAKALFAADLQVELEARAAVEFELEKLEQAFVAQGWLPIDSIVVWKHPAMPGKWVVLEGNRRVATLRRVRERLRREEAKLERITGGHRRFSEQDMREQEGIVGVLKRVIEDTDQLAVVPLQADTTADLVRKLPRILAVRHVTGAKEWRNVATNIWLLRRYEHLYEERSPRDNTLRWDQPLIQQVANEASLGVTITKRKIKAASSWSHFSRDFEDRLPEGEEFKPSDYFLFEEIVKRPFVRSQLGIAEDAWHLPPESEAVLFKWVFALPRGDGNDADSNPNVFYRHYNVELWDRMKRYDDKNGTAFAARFDVEDPDSAPSMRQVEAEFHTHKARRQPADVLEQLLKQLDNLTAEQLANEGAFLRSQLERVEKRVAQLLAMVEAAETV